MSARGVKFQLAIQNPGKTATETVLCLPGALGTGPSDFQHLLQGGLGSQFKVIALDPRGLGGSTTGTSDSTKIERDYPPDFYIRDALDAGAVMAELGYDKYHVMGWSDGANTAVHLAAHPETREAVKKLVIWGGNANVTQGDCEAWESLRSIENWSDRMRNDKAAIHGGLEQLQALNEKATDGWISLYTDPQKAGDVCLKALHYVQCPTLVVHGMKDVVSSIGHARFLAKQITNSELMIFPDGKHNLHQRYADEFHAAVKHFLLENEGVNEDKEAEEPVIDDIAYAFMGSKALSTALTAGVFDAIHDHSESPGFATFAQVERGSSIKGERLRTLLSACVALKLTRRRNVQGMDQFTLPKASADQLVRSSKRYWGDYISGQVDAQFYARMVDLDEIMRTGNSATSGYEAWFGSDPEAAQRYTEAQHNGSLATAHALHRRLPELSNKFPQMQMLDVGGGSGAFSITTARKIPGAECIVLDLPNVTKVAETIISKEAPEVQKRVSTLSLSATAPDEWQGLVADESMDVVLMSYVSGSIPAAALPALYQNAFRVLKPGGVAVVHDFFVDNDGKGPRNAALWALAHVTVNPEGMGLRPNRIVDMLAGEGFVAPMVDDLIPGATQVITATKPRSTAL